MIGTELDGPPSSILGWSIARFHNNVAWALVHRDVYAWWTALDSLLHGRSELAKSIQVFTKILACGIPSKKLPLTHFIFLQVFKELCKVKRRLTLYEHTRKRVARLRKNQQSLRMMISE